MHKKYSVILSPEEVSSLERLVSSGNAPTRPDIYSAVWMLRDCELAWPPGERFLYSDAGYQVLALVLEAVTGRPIAQILHAILSGTPYYRFFTQ